MMQPLHHTLQLPIRKNTGRMFKQNAVTSIIHTCKRSRAVDSSKLMYIDVTNVYICICVCFIMLLGITGK